MQHYAKQRAGHSHMILVGILAKILQRGKSMTQFLYLVEYNQSLAWLYALSGNGTDGEYYALHIIVLGE